MTTEQLTKQWANSLAETLHYDADQRDVIAYGLFAVVHTMLAIGATTFIGAICGVGIEALIVSFTIATLKKVSGGIHATSPGRCLTLGVMVCVLIAWLSVCLMELPVKYIVGGVVALGIWAYVMIGYKVPVDSVAKPIKNSSKRQRLKRQSWFVLTIQILLVTLCIGYGFWIGYKQFYTYGLCILLGFSWQVVTLTRSGEWIIQKMDFLLINKLKPLRGSSR